MILKYLFISNKNNSMFILDCKQTIVIFFSSTIFVLDILSEQLGSSY